MNNTETIRYLNTANLVPFKEHPFKSRDGEEQGELLKSIKAQRAIEPLIVRPLAAGKYEIISGHRRLEACKELGIKNIPVIVRNLTDEQAVIMMADANLHREQLLPSEKAFAYKTGAAIYPFNFFNPRTASGGRRGSNCPNARR